MEVHRQLAGELASVGERAIVVGRREQADVEEVAQCTFHLGESERMGKWVGGWVSE